MKILKTLCFATSMLLLASCGGSGDSQSTNSNQNEENTPIKLTVENSEVKGSLKGIINIVEREYTTNTDVMPTFSAEFKRTDAPLDLDFSDINTITLSVEFLDDNNNVVDTYEHTERPWSTEENKLSKFLTASSTDDVCAIEVFVHDNNVKKFRIFSSVEMGAPEASSDDADDSNNAVAAPAIDEMPSIPEPPSSPADGVEMPEKKEESETSKAAKNIKQAAKKTTEKAAKKVNEWLDKYNED